MYRSENLGIEWDENYKVKAPTNSALYWGIFDQWWKRYPLMGEGILVGEEYPKLTHLKQFFYDKFPHIEDMVGVSLENSDTVWDITKTAPFNVLFDWIICQAVLEHVSDPVAAVRNMVSVTNVGGMIYLHSHGPKFKEHRWPVDCWRFLRDGVVGLAEQTCCEIVDLLWTESHWFMLMKV